MTVYAGNGRRRVESRGNARVKALRAGLRHGPAEGQIALEGMHLVEEALRSGLRLRTAFVREGSEPLLQHLALGDAEVLTLPPDVFASAVLTESPQGMAALADAPVFTLPQLLNGGVPLLVIAAGLQDPGNLGTLLRSAEAFGSTGMILLPGTVSLWNSKTLRASSGSAFRLPVISMSPEEAFTTLQERGIRICAAVARGGDATFNGRLPSALLIGNEGAGLPEAWVSRADARITIPCPGPAESLNAAVAGSVLLYEAMRQRQMPVTA